MINRKNVLITGASGGIGLAITERLSEEYNVVAQYNRNNEKLNLFIQNNANKNHLMIKKADLRYENEIESLFNAAEQKFGHIEILINCAGISYYNLIQDTKFSDMDEVLRTNLYSNILCCKRAVNNMIKHKFGVILNLSSIWGQSGSSMESIYSASKGAIDSFTKSLAKELIYSNIRVNAISPGIVNTDMISRDFTEDEYLYLINETPLKRFIDPCEIAELAYYLISDKARSVTGQIIRMDGGFDL